MTIEEAKKIVLKRYPKKVIVNATDFKNLYVFVLRLKEHADKPLLTANVAVEKNTGTIRPFLPMREDYKEYFKKQKREVNDYV